MPLKKYSVILPKNRGQFQSETMPRLDHFLASELPSQTGQPLSRGQVRKLIVAGAVYLNGKRVRIASKNLLPGARVEVFIDLELLTQSLKNSGTSAPFALTEENILFEDEDLIVWNKPPGLPTQPTLDEARQTLFSMAKEFLKKTSRGDYLGLHHRLDRDTSGLVLMTKSKRINAGVAQLFANHQIQKIYLALTETKDVPSIWEVKNYLGKAKDSRQKKAKFCSVRSGGDFAHTKFAIREKLRHGLCIEARPLTGRTHQIRVHLSEEGLPIFGDIFYGGKTKFLEKSIPRVMLHAAELVFPHPLSKKEIYIQSPLPIDFAQCKRLLV